MENNADNRLIVLDHISFRRDNRIILDDINLTVNRGDFVAITGPNGGGKTTLLRILLRLLNPTSGKVIYYDRGNCVDNLKTGYLPQKNMIDSWFPISVTEVVASGLLGINGLSRSERDRLVTETIEQVGLTDRSHQSIGTLSGGQLQRALMGRAIISRPEVLILDEPLSYVDKKFEHRIYEIVSGLSRSTTILLVSHEMSTIAGMANRHIIIDRNLQECHSLHHHVHYDCDCH